MVFYKFASNQSQIYRFISHQGFLYLCCITIIHHIWLYLIIFNRSGYIEKNSGPKSNSYQHFFICHLNLNRISAHNLLKLSLLWAYITVHNCMLYVYQRFISTHPFTTMIIIYRFQVIIYVEKIILWILNEAVFVFTAKSPFHLKLKISITSTNALILK